MSTRGAPNEHCRSFAVRALAGEFSAVVVEERRKKKERAKARRKQLLNLFVS